MASQYDAEVALNAAVRANPMPWLGLMAARRQKLEDDYRARQHAENLLTMRMGGERDVAAMRIRAEEGIAQRTHEREIKLKGDELKSLETRAELERKGRIEAAEAAVKAQVKLTTESKKEEMAAKLIEQTGEKRGDGESIDDFLIRAGRIRNKRAHRTLEANRKDEADIEAKIKTLNSTEAARKLKTKEDYIKREFERTQAISPDDKAAIAAIRKKEPYFTYSEALERASISPKNLPAARLALEGIEATGDLLAAKVPKEHLELLDSYQKQLQAAQTKRQAYSATEMGQRALDYDALGDPTAPITPAAPGTGALATRAGQMGHWGRTAYMLGATDVTPRDLTGPAPTPAAPTAAPVAAAPAPAAPAAAPTAADVTVGGSADAWLSGGGRGSGSGGVGTPSPAPAAAPAPAPTEPESEFEGFDPNAMSNAATTGTGTTAANQPAGVPAEAEIMATLRKYGEDRGIVGVPLPGVGRRGYSLTVPDPRQSLNNVEAEILRRLGQRQGMRPAAEQYYRQELARVREMMSRLPAQAAPPPTPGPLLGPPAPPAGRGVDWEGVSPFPEAQPSPYQQRPFTFPYPAVPTTPMRYPAPPGGFEEFGVPPPASSPPARPARPPGPPVDRITQLFGPDALDLLADAGKVSVANGVSPADQQATLNAAVNGDPAARRSIGMVLDYVRRSKRANVGGSFTPDFRLAPDDEVTFGSGE